MTLRTSITASKFFPSIIILHLNCLQNIPLPIQQLTIQSPQGTHPKKHLNSKVHIFHYFFTKKLYFITTIQFKLVVGIICIYVPILLYFQFFNLFVQISEIGDHTFSISHKNEDPSPLRVPKSNRMKYHCPTKWVPCHLAIIKHETNKSLKSH